MKSCLLCHITQSCCDYIVAVWPRTKVSYVDEIQNNHDDIIKWKQSQRNCPFVRGNHRSPVNFSHKGRWRGALMFPLTCAWMNVWANYHEAGNLRRYRAYYDAIVMMKWSLVWKDTDNARSLHLSYYLTIGTHYQQQLKLKIMIMLMHCLRLNHIPHKE